MSEGSEKRKAVVLVSGGLDSTVSAAVAKSKGFNVRALTIQYGQRHARELMSAKKVCASLGISDHKVLSVDLRCFGASALTDELAVPKDREPGASGIPITYVPARNTVFLSLALAFAEAEGARDIFYRCLLCRLLRLSRLSSGVHRCVRKGGQSGHSRRG